MPSPYSSAESLERRERGRRPPRDPAGRDPDRRRCSRRTSTPRRACSPAPSRDVAEENLQARIRGNLLMALSNKFGSLVLTTGNKSEMAVGYSTLYGDMAGGFAPIMDVPKTLVYELARWRNGRRPGDRATPSREPSSTEAAHRRAPARPARHRLAPALRRPRPDPRGLRRGGPLAGGDRRRGLRSGDRVAGGGHGRPRRVQAASGAAGGQDHAEGVRPRPAAPDHEPVPAVAEGLTLGRPPGRIGFFPGAPLRGGAGITIRLVGRAGTPGRRPPLTARGGSVVTLMVAVPRCAPKPDLTARP